MHYAVRSAAELPVVMGDVGNLRRCYTVSWHNAIFSSVIVIKVWLSLRTMS